MGSVEATPDRPGQGPDWKQVIARMIRPAVDPRPEVSDRSENPESFQVVVVPSVPTREIIRVSAVLLGVGLAVYLVFRLQQLLFLIFLALLLATTIEPLVLYLRRGPFGRASGVLAIYTLIIVVIAVPIILVAPNLVSQMDSFTTGLPDRLKALHPLVQGLQPKIVQEIGLGVLDEATNFVGQSSAPASDTIVAAGTSALLTVFDFLMVFVLAFYWLMERNALKRSVLRAVPRHRAKHVNQTWVELEEKLGAWVRGQLILMLIIAVLAGITFVFFGLPSPLLLAVVAGLAEVIPILGPYLAFAPALVVTLIVAPEKVLLIAGCAVVIQLIETNILVPRIMSKTVGISPLTIIIGIQAGAILYGLPGALLAVPIAAALQVILAHTLRSDDPSASESSASAMSIAATRSSLVVRPADRSAVPTPPLP